MIDERSWRVKPREEYMDGVKEGRSYVVIKRLSMEGRNHNPTNLWVEKSVDEKRSYGMLINLPTTCVA